MSKLALKTEDRLTGSENFTAWKYRIMSLFAEHELEDFVTGEVKNLLQQQQGQPSRGNKTKPEISSSTLSKTTWYLL